MTVATFVVERPVSINRTYARGKGRRLFMTSEGLAFKERIRTAAFLAVSRGDWPQSPWVVARAEVRYQLYNVRCDTDAVRKITRDALEGIMYVNDRIVQDGPAPLPIKDDGGPRMIVVVSLLEQRTYEEATVLRLRSEKARRKRLVANRTGAA